MYWRGGGFIDPNAGGGRVGRSAGRVPQGRGGTPTCVPQNDPHDPLIVLNVHKWGSSFAKKTKSPSAPGVQRD